MEGQGVAYKLGVKDLLEGSYVRTEGQFEPNYLSIGDRKVTRVNLIAVIVSSEEDGVVLDDGSGRIEARVMPGFDFKLPSAGNVALVIGRPRQHNQSIYLVPEIIKAMTPGWLEHRKIELGNENISKPEKVIKLIRMLDKGDGSDIEEVIAKSGMPECEKIVNMLLQEGDIFKIKHGRLKALD
jgi:uncharacterized protein